MNRYAMSISLLTMINFCAAAMEPADQTSKKNKERLVADFNKKISFLKEEDLQKEEPYINTRSTVPVSTMLEFNQALKREDTSAIIEILKREGSRATAFRNTYRLAQLAYDVYKGELDSIVISPDDLQGISLDSFSKVLLELAKKGGNKEFLKKHSIKDYVNAQDVRTDNTGFGVLPARLPSLSLTNEWLESADQDWRNELNEMYKNDFLPAGTIAPAKNNSPQENVSNLNLKSDESSSDYSGELSSDSEGD